MSDPASSPPHEPGAGADKTAAADKPAAAAEKRGLLVVQIGPPEPLDEGPAIYRAIQPCRALGEMADVAAISGSTLSPALFDSGLLLTADVLVVRNGADPDLLPILAARRRQRRLSVYELDRHLFAASPAKAPAVSTGTPPLDLATRSLAPLLARQADCMQVASAALEAQLASLNPRRAVFPSQLWDAPPPPPVRRLDEVVIGWGGSAVHHPDLRAVVPALAGVLERHPEVRVAIMGHPGAQEAVAALPQQRVSYTPWGSLRAYYDFLAGVDIGIAPLWPTPFNRCLSDIRFVELAAHGVLAVCADLEPYRDVVRPGQTGFLFRDPSELETVLERALAEGEVRAAIPARAARYAAAERLERHHVSARLGFYLSVAAQLGLPIGGRRDVAASFPSPELLAAPHAGRTFPGSRYVALGDGQAERLLTEGLAHARAGDRNEARRALMEAARLIPRSHLPPLLLGEIETPAAAVEALRRAESLNPSSCHAAFLRGARLLELGAEGEAAAAFERARSIAPGYGAPQERLGAMAEAAGRIEDACRLYEEAALQNSAFALPIARLATLAQRDGKIDKAVGLLERSLTDDPDLWLTNFLLGRTYVELKRFHQARMHLRKALDGAEDRPAVLAELARAEVGLGNMEAARNALEEARNHM